MVSLLEGEAVERPLRLGVEDPGFSRPLRIRFVSGRFDEPAKLRDGHFGRAEIETARDVHGKRRPLDVVVDFPLIRAVLVRELEMMLIEHAHLELARRNADERHAERVATDFVASGIVGAENEAEGGEHGKGEARQRDAACSMSDGRFANTFDVGGVEHDADHTRIIRDRAIPFDGMRSVRPLLQGERQVRVYQ